MDREYQWPVRVYFEDTDAGGVVYHSQYLNFLERARTEYLRHLGFNQSCLRNEYSVLFVVRRLKADFHQAACFDDMLLVKTFVNAISATRVQFEQSIYLKTVAEGQAKSLAHKPLFSAAVEVVCVSVEGFRPCRIPALIQSALEV